MTDRIYNFSAGPAVLPEPVLKQAQKDLWNMAGSGIGILEHSHRGKVFDKVLDETERDGRDLGGIPDNYKVLFLQGGASLQFAMVPMNLLPRDRTADYLVTGVWSEKAVKEAKVYGTVHEAASGKACNFSRIPTAAGDQVLGQAGRTCTSPPTTRSTAPSGRPSPPPPAGVPLVADASSDIFSRPIDVKRYGLIYAGAQKNLGPSGVVLVIIRDDLAEAGPKDLPTMLQYRTFVAERSLYNTPPTFGIYVMGLVFKWIKARGGLQAMADQNQRKAKLLYDYLDQSRMFRCNVEPGSRSLMNVCFRGPDEETENRFIAEATKRGFDGLKGHRSAGGMRASIYNAFPVEGVEALVEFMKEFELGAKS